MSPQLMVYVIWGLWFLSWWITALIWAKPAEKKPSWKNNWGQRVITLLGMVLLLGLWAPALLAQWRWSLPETAGRLMVLLTILGFAFCWWARIHLGQYWAADVGRKKDHRVIVTVPYALVRHPIYTGIILASFPTVLVMGTASSLLGAIILIVGWYVKARMEERFLRDELGAPYEDYAARTAMLVPFFRF